MSSQVHSLARASQGIAAVLAVLLPVIRGWFEFLPADRGDVRRLCGEINTILR